MKPSDVIAAIAMGYAKVLARSGARHFPFAHGHGRAAEVLRDVAHELAMQYPEHGRNLYAAVHLNPDRSPKEIKHE